MEIDSNTNKKKKVLILYNKLFHYRIPIFNILAEKYDLTVVYSYNTNEKELAECEFKTKYIPIKQIWKFVIHKENIFSLCQDYEYVIAIGQSTWLSYSFLGFRKKRNFKLFFWGIGVPASYHRKYGDAGFFHYKFNDFFNKRADGLIFYSDAPIEIHQKRGFVNPKMFVANNTVKVIKQEFEITNRKNLLFIGTLYLEKGLSILLKAYYEANKENGNIPILKIIGGGDEFNKISEWIKNHDLSEKIQLLGPIYDESIKAQIFSNTIASISPLQAGLSVLESMGYGVPYITLEDAITGGEAFNIINGVNGLRLHNVDEFKNVIIDIANNNDKYLNFGLNAYNYYWTNRKPEDMARGLSDAIEQTN